MKGCVSQALARCAALLLPLGRPVYTSSHPSHPSHPDFFFSLSLSVKNGDCSLALFVIISLIIFHMCQIAFEWKVGFTYKVVEPQYWRILVNKKCTKYTEYIRKLCEKETNLTALIATG